ncbi:hypothetical protein BDV96DRAFT_637477 [Lophiotrema nucula]|uniref:DUF7730 domain-containing protein n=1 Tax=Lophiotrema nucula TaxID=690887 RepID=A0A6A5YN14_9PLEO|nr:hypothetical protein BDV96DRAFT_637477 [Lophiotrema nucula]
MATFVPMKGSPRKPPTIQIPNVASSAADPNKISFLDFPAEIRNQINGELLKFDEPIVLIAPEVLGKAEKIAKKVKLMQEIDNFSRLTDDSDSDDEDEAAVTDNVSHHTFDFDLNMLYTCRQVYHEAASLFYGGNTFGFSWHPSVHNIAAGQIEYCAKWLTRIGSQFTFLKNVNIDVSLVCPTSCRCCNDRLRCGSPRRPPTWVFSGNLEILSLIQVMWVNPAAACTIQFIQGDQKMDTEMFGDDTEEEEEEEGKPEITVDHLNKALISLSQHDNLGLQKYGRFERFFTHMFIHRRDGTGFVEYRSDSALPIGNFQVMDSGETTWTNHQSSAKILGLPYQVLEKICGLVVYKEAGIAFNFDNKSAANLEAGLSGAHRYLRSIALTQLYEQNDFKVILESSDPRTSFDGFKSLKGVWSKKRPGALQFFNSDRRFPRSLELVLRVQSKTNMDLSDLRISILGLIRATRKISERYGNKTSVTFSLAHEQNGEQQTRSLTLNLQELQIRVFHMLSIVLQSSPQVEHSDCPEVWVNGHGHATEAIHSDSHESTRSVYANVHPILDGFQIKWVCLNFARELDKHALKRVSGPFFFCYSDLEVSLKKDRSLIGLWSYLRNIMPWDWYGWKADSLQNMAQQQLRIAAQREASTASI